MLPIRPFCIGTHLNCYLGKKLLLFVYKSLETVMITICHSANVHYKTNLQPF